MLQTGQGIPAPPQSQPCWPSHGHLGWFSQTQPVSAQKMHCMDATRQRQRKPGNWAGRTQVYIGIETEILEQSPKAVYPYQYRQLI
jgi:hypothetical protein